MSRRFSKRLNFVHFAVHCLLFLMVALPSGAENLIRSEEWSLAQPEEGVAGFERLPGTKETGGNEILRLVIRKPSDPFYAVALDRDIEKAVPRDHRLRLRFRARSFTRNPVRVVVEKAGPPYTSVVSTAPELTKAWKEYEATGTAETAYGRNSLHLRIQAGHQPGVVEIAGVRVEDIGPDPAMKAAFDALSPKRIRERIRKHRMGILRVVVRNAEGKPVPRAQVKVEQTRHAFLFGSNAFNLDPENTEPWQKAYQNRFTDLFNSATFGFYWSTFEREPGKPRYEEMDARVRWGVAHGLTLKGHPLIWHETYPAWAPKTAGETVPMLRERVTEILRRYREEIPLWDVINEANVAADFPQTGVGSWIHEAGPAKAVATALEWARAASRGADTTLLYNDFNTGEQNVELLTQLKKWGQLPDAVGIQSHMHSANWRLERVWLTAERFSQFGVPVHFTEVTVISGPRREKINTKWPYDQDWLTTPEGEAEQADYLIDFYRTLFSHPNVHAITYWDFSDRGTWLGAPAGLLRRDMSPKPAYTRLKELIRGQWWTDESGRASRSGQTSFRVYHGDHRVTVTAGKRTATRTVTLPVGSASQTLTVTLE